MSRRPHRPTGDTPTPSPKKARGRGRGQSVGRALYDSLTVPGGLSQVTPNISVQDTSHKKPPVYHKKPTDWGENESAELVKFIALHHAVEEGNDWPSHNRTTFWEECSKSVSEKTGKHRTGGGCRAHMMRLQAKFPKLHEAEERFNVRYTADIEEKENNPSASSTSSQKTRAASLSALQSQFNVLTPSQQWDFMDDLFRYKLEKIRPSLPDFVPHNFLKLSAEAMDTLKTKGRNNTLYHLAHALGTPREDGSGPRMPVDRMPFPMIEHNAKFFSVDHPDQLRCPEEYIAYMETMYAHFGNKWASLHSGPMWSGTDNDDKEDQEEDNNQERMELLSLANCRDEPELDVLAEAMKELEGTDDLGIATLPCDGDITIDSSQPETCFPWLLQEDWEKEMVPLTSTPSKSAPTEHSSSSESEHIRSYSFLYSSATQSERREAQEGLPPEELQRIHQVQPSQQTKSRARLKTMDAKVNIAGVSSRTLRKKISAKDFVCNTAIQVTMLSKAHTANPDGRWWIKADACDLKAGLRESLKHEWSGDTDLGEGKLEELEAKYQSEQIFVANLGLGKHSDKAQLSKDIACLLALVEEEKGFLENGCKEAERLYVRKQTELNASADSLFALGWELDSYKKLLVVHAEVKSTMEGMVVTLKNDKLPGGLRHLREQLKWFLKGLYTKKREAASHLLIFMISEEKRNTRPYAIPVRVLPCRVVKDAVMRTLKDELKMTMEAIGMVVVGFVTDGEWNSLRTMGGNRPVSMIQLIMESRAEARSETAANIRKYLTLRDDPANPLPVVGHEAVPLEDVVWLSHYIRENNKTFEEAIHILRKKHFPFMYDPHPWTPGRRNETTADCLKSLMATYILRKKVNDWQQMGVDFSNNLYVPEVGEGSEPHFDREDHGHVLKRLTACVRAGQVPAIQMRRWVEAMQNSDTGLTFTALTGKRKQSVADCERMFSPGVVQFFKDKGYKSEAWFAETVHNWHKATDGRGIDQETRKKYNHAMLSFLLEDWMPYHSFIKDYAMLDVNRPIKGIQGLTREVVVALLCNIESQEQRRNMQTTRGLPPEHPRAGTSDDVEAFIATLHGLLGPIFDQKAFRENYRKICHEYAKRIDRDLPYWYHTGINTRFQSELPSFDQPSGHTERLDRTRESRFADPGIDNPCRVQMPRRGARTIRATFHNREEELPPPPQA
ncbi:uncharacterized protein LOC144909356 [Branchiostoma floridae x Branchiostoma belcheri]